MMLFVMSQFLLKEIVFIESVKAISLSVFFTSRISTIRLFKFMNLFSMDLNTTNLNISRIWLINTLLFLKMKSLLGNLMVVGNPSPLVNPTRLIPPDQIPAR